MNPFDPKYFQGKNDLGSFDTFLERIFFKGFALSKDGRPKTTIDETKNLFFSEIGLHGKINPQGTPITSNTGRLTKINQKKEVFVFDFVARAFQDFKEAISTAIRSGNMSASDKHFEKLEATSGWFDSSAGYNLYMNNLKSFFMNYLQRLSPEKKRGISDVGVFSEIFLEFYDFFSTSFPLTRSGFMMSGMVSNQCSGMMLTIADYDYSSDEEKIRDFYNSVNLRAYKQAAISHGFLIDKNAPWRLIADIDNPVMQAYINQETMETSFDRKSFFGTYFLSSDNDPISDLKIIISNFYQAAIQANKIQRKIAINSKNCFEITSSRLPTKKQYQIIAGLSEIEWAELYLKIKNYETKINYSDKELKNMARNLTDLRKKLDSRPYMLYIRNRFPQIPFSEGSTNYRETKKYILESGKSTETSLGEEIKRATRIKKKTIF
jgi:hypothetical protein